MPTNSDVSAQPASIEETYEGAQNRHAALQKAVASQQAAYLVTVESGLHSIHSNHNVFASTVVVLEKAGSIPKTGINVEIEYPTAMTDKVPSVYPDLGTLVQQEYGAVLKDPIPFFTNDMISRQQFVENAVFNVAAQLETN
jgi:non-canonical (house-cleaning) NTP pyrophosphatase